MQSCLVHRHHCVQLASLTCGKLIDTRNSKLPLRVGKEGRCHTQHPSLRCQVQSENVQGESSSDGGPDSRDSGAATPDEGPRPDDVSLSIDTVQFQSHSNAQLCTARIYPTCSRESIPALWRLPCCWLHSMHADDLRNATQA